jgi:hypothetical protein
MKYLQTALSLLAGSAACVNAQTLSNYQAVVLGQSPSYYFKFDAGTLTSAVGGKTLTASPAGVAGQLAPDVFGNASDSFFFTANNDVLYDPTESSDHLISGGGTATTNSTASGSISVLFRTVDPGPQPGNGAAPGQHFVFSAGGANVASNGLALFIDNTTAATDPVALKLRFGDTTTTLVPAASLVPDRWYYFALTYTEAPVTNKATWYLGRLAGGGTALASGTTSNLLNAVAGDATSFFIGGNSNFTSNLRNPGNGQVDEFATWTRQLSAAEVQAQYASLPNFAIPARSNYQAVISGQSPAHYFKLDGNASDSVDGTLAFATNGTAVGYSFDYFNTPLSAAYFSVGADALVANTNLLNGGGTFTGSTGAGMGTVSCLFHSLASTNVQGQRHVFSAGGSSASSNAFALFFENLTGTNPASLKIRFGDSSSVILQPTNIVSSAWYYFAMTYDETQTNHQVSWWLGQPGGSLQSGFFSALPSSLAGQGNVFVVGNNTNFNSGLRNSTPSGAGSVDEVATWNRLLGTNEIAAQFGALSIPKLPPVLSITASAGNVILSWPSSTDPGFLLESTPSLSPASWSGAGAAVVVGNQYVVTNSVTPGDSFYRLRKP